MIKKISIIKIFILTFLINSILFGCSYSNNSNKGFPNLKGEKLVVYVAFNDGEAEILLKGFKEKTGCNYSFLRFPTETAASRVINEKNLPKADIFLGGTADAVELLKSNNCLEKYVSKNAKNIPIKYRDSDDFWTGLYVEPLSIGINEDRWNKEFKNEKEPNSIEALLNPKFKGEIVLPDPRTSGTGYTFLSYLVQTMGEKEAINFFAKLKNNVGQFTDSGFTPAKKVGIGEYLITVNFINQQLIVKNSGFRIKSIIPTYSGWTICPIAKIKNGPNSKAAEAFIEYCSTKGAGNALKDFSMAISTIDGVEMPAGGKKIKSFPLYKKYDFYKAAIDRERILKELSKIM